MMTIRRMILSRLVGLPLLAGAPAAADSGSRSLADAARLGDREGLDDVIAYLAGKGANLDAKDGFGQTPLSIAYALVTKGLLNAYYQTARSLHRDTAELLLKLGATPIERSGIVVVNQRAGE